MSPNTATLTNSGVHSSERLGGAAWSQNLLWSGVFLEKGQELSGGK